MSTSQDIALLRRLSEELVSVSGGTAERLASLATAIEDPLSPTAWAGIDLFRVIDVQAVGDLLLRSPDRDPVLARFEQIRNFLTVLPILLTLLALFFAGGAYQHAVQADPALTQEPFLLLWEQGFNGYAQGGLGLLSALTPSHVAITDVAVMAVVVLVTGYIHRETKIKQTQRARRAVELKEQLSQALWFAAMQLAQRAPPHVQLDQLRVLTEQLLDARSELGTLEQPRTRPTVRPPASVGDKYDVFISHASEDKEAVARPLAELLQDAGLRVWYDDFTLTLGDSLRRSIERGLAKSRFGIVILSPSFFAKSWPQEELNGLFAREIGGAKVILPIWHELGSAELLKRAPMLADRVAARTSEGLDVVVVRILEVVHLDTGQTD
jgi:hypothetical protein